MELSLDYIFLYSLPLVLFAAACLAVGRTRGITWSVLFARLAWPGRLRAKITERLSAIATNEKRYRELFDAMSEGFALHEIILNRRGVPCDYRFLDMNPAFEAQTGLTREQCVGRRILEIFPDLEQEWIDSYGRVALTGEPARFERYVGALDKHYSVVAFSPKPRQFAVLAIDITDRKRVEEDTSLKNALLQTQQEASLDGILAVGTEGQILFYNQRFIEMWGISTEVFKGGFDGPVLRAVSEKTADPDRFSKRVRYLYSNSEETARDEVLLADGRTLDRYSAPMLEADGRCCGRVWYFRDISDRKQAEAQISLHSAALNAADDLIAIMDDRGNVVFANDAFRRQTGHSLEEIAGRHLSSVWSQTPAGIPLEEVWDSKGSGCAWSGEMLCKSHDDSTYTADVSITPLLNGDGRAVHWIAIARNITERKVYEGLLDYQAHHDALTDLPNRVRFTQELADTLLERQGQQQCAVLFVDLDRFKLVNDTMGHHAGDCVLVEVALRLGSCLRGGDVLARIGGDEFIAVLKNIKSTKDAGSVADRMLQQMSEPFEIRGSKLVIGASIGISIFPDNATEVETLISRADAAMYRAKELGRNNRQFYSEELNETNQARVEMERDLRLAVERREIKVFYQPIVEAKTMRLAGAEALLRWDHPEKGIISPGLFIPVAEETGLIVEIGRNVLESACRQTRLWRDQGYGDLGVSVNVSAVQLRSSAFAKEVLQILSQTDLPPEHLSLEITENMLERNDYGEVETLGELNAAGVKICLDDFGLGYSSLGRLKDLPIAGMKVDGSFIKDIARNHKDRAVTESIMSMAHSLGVSVSAEWIENEEQMATIRLLECDYAQGYFISPALTAVAFEEFVRGWPDRIKKAA